MDVAGRLATLYENELNDPRSALGALNLVYDADPDDFQAVQRIVELAERLEEWGTVAEHTARLVEVEGDDEEVSRMTRHLAEVLSEKLDRGEEALVALVPVAEQGDPELPREAFVELSAIDSVRRSSSRRSSWSGSGKPRRRRSATNASTARSIDSWKSARTPKPPPSEMSSRGFASRDETSRRASRPWRFG